MGCSCEFMKKTDTKNEMVSDVISNIEEISNDKSKINSIIKIQRKFREMQNKSKTIETNKNSILL